MTAVRCWRRRCLAQGKNLQAGGRSWLQQNAGERLRRTSCRHVRGTRGSDAFGAFLQAVAGYRWKMRLPVVTLQVTLENDRKFSA
jgi:hypothetical protein